MNMKPIKTEADYNAALQEIEQLFDAQPGSENADRLEVLVTLVKVYEDEHYPIPAPDPIEFLNYFMESRGLQRSDIEPYIGSRARVSEILNRKRPLTLNMIQRLSIGLNIPASALIQAYELATSKQTNKPRSLAA
jgi:HTH-type transcriptional regulator / antitoxin HigA